MSVKQDPELERALQLAADRRATDIFLLPGEPLSLRVGDRIERTDAPPYSPDAIRDLATAALGPDRVASLPTTGHASTSCHLPGVATGQLTAAFANGQLAVTVRVIPSHIPTPKEIALPDELLEAATQKSGLILFSGPVGSGKTTSAYSLLSHINETQPKLICTVEEPIAFSFTAHRPLILQREVGTDCPDTLAGIAASVRQDADVLFVGELKSPDEAAACLTAAGLSRLVITQTHARTAARAVERLIEIQPPDQADRFRRQLAESLVISVAQTLLPTPDGKRVAAYEILVPDDAFRRALATAGSVTRPPGSRTIPDQIRALADAGKVSAATASGAVAEFAPLYRT
jgi:twitching motility protein PilT